MFRVIFWLFCYKYLVDSKNEKGCFFRLVMMHLIQGLTMHLIFPRAYGHVQHFLYLNGILRFIMNTSLGEAFFCTARTAFPVKNLVTSAYVAITAFSTNAAICWTLYCETAVPAASSCRSFVKGSFSTMWTDIKVRHKNHLLSLRCSIRTV